MKYQDLIHFEPIESIIQLRDSSQKDYALKLIDTYVISDRMAETLDEMVFEQLQFDHAADNKGLFVVGNYGTGKSHLMSVISTIAEHNDVTQYIRNKRVANKAKVIEGRFQVVRSEIGSTEMSLRTFICGELEDRLEDLGVDFKFPPADQVRNNKDAFLQMMSEFYNQYPDQGLLMVVDELLDFLRARKEQELILDLGFLREIGEVCKNTRFRFMAGIQEMLFDNPKFQFVAAQLGRVKERFEQVYIVREDIAYVVSERLLKKDEKQKALIREHLQKFTRLYDMLSERLEEYVNLFPIHPAYLSTFEKVIVAEKRVILKTISLEIKKNLSRDVPLQEPGLISYDSYWPYIEGDPGLKIHPEIREVMSKSKILQDKIQNAFTKPIYRPIALRIVNALSVHRLTTGNIYDRLGATSEELRDTLFIYVELPEEDAEFLRSTIDTVLREILKTVSWQYISFNEDNGQYYIDIDKDIPVDDFIQNKADGLSDNLLDRYYFEALTQVMGCPTNTYVTNYRIWSYELPWWTSKVTRYGYLFFGAPNERSTAQPPRDYYVYVLQPFDQPKFKNEDRPDEVFIKLKKVDETFKRSLSLYAGARELATTATAGTKHLYEEKANDFFKQVTKWLRDNLLEAFEVVYKGVTKKLKDSISNMPPQATSREILDAVAQTCLTSWFDEMYPEYPHFRKLKTPMTKDMLPVYVMDALKYIGGATAVNGLALTDGLVLLENEKLNIQGSGYVSWVLDILSAKAQGQVVNRSELIETIYSCQGTPDVELTQQFKLEPELLVVILAALIYNGDIVVTINGVSYDAMKYDQFIKLSLAELKDFSHIKRPIGLPLPALKALFDLLGLAPGLLQPNSLSDGVIQMNRVAEGRLMETVETIQMVKTGIPCWDGSILSQTEQNEYQTQLEELKSFLESILVYNAPAKLNNFKYSVQEVDKQQKALDLMKQINALKQRVQEISFVANYLWSAQQHLPEDHPWQIEAERILSDMLNALKNSSDCHKESFDAQNLKADYQKIYMEMHAKSRLNAAEDNRKTSLMNDLRVIALKQLASIDLLPDNLATNLLGRISGLQTCWCLTKQDLENQTICPHCKYRPKDDNGFKKPDTLDSLDDQVQDMLDNWTNTLIHNCNDSEVRENITLLKLEQQKLVTDLIKNEKFSLPIEIPLLQAIKELLQGIERVGIPMNTVKQAFGNGSPLTVEEVRINFERLLQKHIGQQPISRVRVILKED